MRHRVFGNRLSRPANQRKALAKSLLTSLFTHGRIKTTLAKAKAISGEADKVVNNLKGQTIAERREVAKIFPDNLAKELFRTAKERFSGRGSGYTRIIRLGERFSDTADLVYLEFVEAGTPAEQVQVQEQLQGKTTTKTEAKKEAKAAGRGAKGKGKPKTK